MRVLQFHVLERQRETVRRVLESENIDYTVTEAASDEGDVVVVEFPIPRQAVEHVLEQLREEGIDVDSQYRVNLHADVARTRNLDDFIERVVNGKEESDFIARDELKARAQDMVPSVITYYMMTVLGVLVATSGLLLNSPSVVVGSMVLAPQLGAALTSTVGIVTNDRQMILDGLAAQVTGLWLGLSASVVFGIILRATMVVSPSLSITTLGQIGGRASPGVLSVVISVAAGTAAVFSLVAHDSPSGPLVGVMVSAALIPAAAAAGLGIAWGLPRVAIGALVLLTINVISINLTGPVVLWLLGYRPENWGSRSWRTAQTAVEHAPSILAVLLLLGGFVGTGVVLGQQIGFEREVRASIDDVLERKEFETVQLHDISTEYVDMGFVDSPQKITVEVSDASNETYPELDDRLQRRVASHTGVSVNVLVEYRNLTGGSASVVDVPAEKIGTGGRTAEDRSVRRGSVARARGVRMRDARAPGTQYFGSAPVVS